MVHRLHAEAFDRRLGRLPEAQMPMLDVHGEDVVNGGTLPMDIWSADMAEVTTQDPVLDFPRLDRREFVPLSRGYAVNPADSSPSVTTFVSSAAEVRRRYGYESGPPGSDIKLHMDLEGLYGASFIDWEAVATSWAKRTVSSRLLLFAARRYLSEYAGEVDANRVEVIGPIPLAEEIKAAFAALPEPESPAARPWGEFVDAALAAELEMIPYGERPVLLGELRAGLTQATEEAGSNSLLGRWFLARRDALPGEDLPENPEYLPV